MDEASGSQIDNDGSSILSRAWPDGVPPSEAALFARLPVARREKTIARLQALLDIEDMRRENPVARVDMPARARTAGVTTDGLFAIRKKWEADRSLASVVPYLGRAERQPTQRADDDPIVTAANALIAERAGDPDSLLAAELRRLGGGSVPNMIRLVRRLRRQDATDPNRISQVFGRALLVDLCAMDAVTAADPNIPIICALVVERASQLILGYSVAAADDDTIGAQASAVREAMARLSDLGIDVAPVGGPAAVELTIGDGLGIDAAFAAAEQSREAGFDVRANSRGPRRYGQRLVSLLGKRLGRIWWKPRISAPGSALVDRLTLMELSAARATLDAETSAHNEEILAKLAEGGITAGGKAMSGAMTEALRRVLDILEASGSSSDGAASRG